MSVPLDQHPQRVALANELHARPFQPATVPGRVLHLAFKQPRAAAERDPEDDRAHLVALLDRFGAPHPAPEARHHAAELGQFRLKWECHTEFVAYTLYEDGPAETLFAAKLMEHLDPDWLDAAPGKVVAAVQLELLTADDPAAAEAMLAGPLGQAFSGESLAVGRVVDGAGLALGDFRLHEGGFTRFAVIRAGEVGPRRVGRICQRLIDIEVYRTMAMLALPIARRTARRLVEIERVLGRLTDLVARGGDGAADSEILTTLTEVAAEIEAMSAETAFRFGAARAYETIVHERIDMLREVRITGRQQFREFMVRRFDPAMRTVRAAEARLEALATRSARVADLLRTRVNVSLEAQNQALLGSMDRRAALQLRLQQTVEGLSVVAISYYAVGLTGYLLAPVAAALAIGKTTVMAAVTVPVIGAVWWTARRIRRRIEGAR